MKCLAVQPSGPKGCLGQNCQKLTNFHIIASLFSHKLEENQYILIRTFYLTFPLFVPDLYGRMQLPKVYTSCLHYSSFILWICELESKCMTCVLLFIQVHVSHTPLCIIYIASACLLIFFLWLHVHLTNNSWLYYFLL